LQDDTDAWALGSTRNLKLGATGGKDQLRHRGQ